MSFLSVKVDPVSEKRLLETLKTDADTTRRAITRATRKTGSWVRTQAFGAMSENVHVPVSKLRQAKRVALNTPKAAGSFELQGDKPVSAAVFVGLDPIKAIYTHDGQAVQDKGGVTIGGQRFAHSFIAVMPSGHRGIFHREAGAHHDKRGGHWYPADPIEEDTVKLDLDEALGAISNAAGDKLEGNLQHELQYAFEREGR